jgi:hypothetical protein
MNLTSKEDDFLPVLVVFWMGWHPGTPSHRRRRRHMAHRDVRSGPTRYPVPTPGFPFCSSRGKVAFHRLDGWWV